MGGGVTVGYGLNASSIVVNGATPQAETPLVIGMGTNREIAFHAAGATSTMTIYGQTTGSAAYAPLKISAESIFYDVSGGVHSFFGNVGIGTTSIATAGSDQFSLQTSSGINVLAGGVTAPFFVGAFMGNTQTATALAANGSNCSAGSYPLAWMLLAPVESCTAVGGEENTYTSSKTFTGGGVWT